MGAKKSRKTSKKFEHPYPSRYGSHASMVSEWVRPLDGGLVICEDEKGLYVTNKNRLDTGCADPKRWASRPHRDKVYSEVEKIADPLRKKESEDV